MIRTLWDSIFDPELDTQGTSNTFQFIQLQETVDNTSKSIKIRTIVSFGNEQQRPHPPLVKHII